MKSKTNHRLEGLEREADKISQHLKENVGLMNCDLEVIGAILFTRHKGEDEKIDEMMENTSKLMKEAEDLLKKLRNEEI